MSLVLKTKIFHKIFVTAQLRNKDTSCLCLCSKGVSQLIVANIKEGEAEGVFPMFFFLFPTAKKETSLSVAVIVVSPMETPTHV